MSTIQLYGLAESVYTRIVRLALEEKEIDYELVETNVFGESGVPPEHLERNPFGRIPVLKQEDFLIYETQAINAYLDEAFSGIRLTPADVREQARMNQIIGILDSYAYMSMVWGIFVPRVMFGDASSSVDEAVERASVCLQALEGFLDGRDFLVGDAVTLADLHALPMLFYLSQAPEGQQLLSEHASLNAWMEQSTRRRSFIQTRSANG